MADGWVTIFAPTPGQLYVSTQSFGIQAAVNNDTGTKLVTTISEWWDHVVNYVQKNLGATWPIVPFGVSLGGFLATTIATQRTSTIAAYGAHIASIDLWTANPNILAVGASGYLGTPSASTTVAAGSNNVAMPIAGGVLNVGSTTGFASSGALALIRGGGLFGWQVLCYTNKTSTTFTGCTGGNTNNGNLATGDVVQQSTNTAGSDIGFTALNALGSGQQGSVPVGWIGVETSDSLIGYSTQTLLANNAIAASQPVTLFTGSTDHLFQTVAEAAAMSWFTGTVDPLCPKVL